MSLDLGKEFVGLPDPLGPKVLQQLHSAIFLPLHVDRGRVVGEHIRRGRYPPQECRAVLLKVVTGTELALRICIKSLHHSLRLHAPTLTMSRTVARLASASSCINLPSASTCATPSCVAIPEHWRGYRFVRCRAEDRRIWHHRPQPSLLACTVAELEDRLR